MCLQRIIKWRLICERGQSTVEYVLLIGFAVALALIFYNSGLQDSAQGAYTQVEKSLGGELTYAEALTAYGTISKTELQKVDNGQRMAIDRAAMQNLASKFQGMSKEDVKKLLYVDANDEKTLVGKGSNPYGAILFDYAIKNTGDNGQDVSVELRSNGKGSACNLEALEWMQGSYDTDHSQYDRNKVMSSSRYLFSNDAIDPQGTATGNRQAGLHTATVRALFSFDDSGKVNGVTVNVTRSIQVGSNWERDVCEGLSNITVTGTN